MSRLGFVARVTAVVVGIAVVLGGSAACLWVLGPEAPTRWPSAESARELVSGPVDSEVVVGILAVGGWLGWALLVRVIAVEAYAALTGRSSTRLAVGRSAQRRVRRVFSWALVGASSTAVAGSMATLAWDVPNVGAEPAAVWVDRGTVAPPAASEQDRVEPRIHEVRPGDNLWEIAETYYGDGLAWRRIFEANVDREVAPGARLVDPNLIHPGWTLVIPGDPVAEAAGEPALEPSLPTPVPAPELELDAPSAPVVTSSGNSPTPSAASAVDSEPEPSDGADPTPEPGSSVTDLMPLVGTGLLGLGLAAALRRRRRLAMVRRRPGDPLPGPSTASDVILPAEDLWSVGGAARVATALRGVAEVAGRAPTLTITDNRLELTWPDDRQVLPAPWSSPRPGTWVAPLESVVETDSADAERGDSLAGVVTLGEEPDRARFLDLRASPLVAVDGPAALVEPLVKSMALELALRPDPASAPEVMLVEDSSVADVLAGIESRLGSASVFDELPFLVVIADTDVSLPADLLARVAADGAGRLSVVLRGRAPGALQVVLDGTSIAVDLDALECRPAAAGEVLVEAASAPSVPVVDDGESLAGLTDDGPHWLELRVLGTVDLGEHSEGLTPQQASIVALLAIRGPSTASQIQDAVWGRNRPSHQRFKNVLAETRAKLGLERFPIAVDGIYRLAPGVWCDLAEADEELERYRLEGDEAAVETALGLCRGAPFEMPDAWVRHFGWVDMDSVLVRAEARLSDAAHQVATNRLESGDFDGAVRVAEQGLVACPMSEALVRLAARGHKEAGRPGDARAILEAHLHQLDEFGLGEADPETEDLYHSLSVSAAAAATAAAPD